LPPCLTFLRVTPKCRRNCACDDAISACNCYDTLCRYSYVHSNGSVLWANFTMPLHGQDARCPYSDTRTVFEKLTLPHSFCALHAPMLRLNVLLTSEDFIDGGGGGSSSSSICDTVCSSFLSCSPTHIFLNSTQFGTGHSEGSQGEVFGRINKIDMQW
jgi:hypothetical protein